MIVGDTESRTPESRTTQAPRTLGERLPASGEPTPTPDQLLDLFLDWLSDIGFTAYPAQEEAILDLLAGRHVVLDTPTGSGKSLVATALHFKALSEGRRSFYTAPIKALVSEKFFNLARELGPERVGLMTGDASVNRDAPVICCTAEILSNLVLRQGQAAAPPYVIMDEFHYYADRERGVAWQIPLIALPETTFLLMSATLGDMSRIAGHLEKQSGREVSIVRSDSRPVPLDYGYKETPLHETVDVLRGQGRLPAYVVSFTQRDCAERAQALTSLILCTPEERKVIGARLADADLSTPYGKDMRRMLRAGVGVHHAGLLPRYRLLVEQLAQDGLLKVICGTDTLGVGVNIPIRTVVFTGLAKYDGRRVRLLNARDFKQIGGRAGRKGFDERGSIVCQAPGHVIENKRRAGRVVKTSRGGRSPGARKARGGHKGKKTRSVRQKQPPRNAVLWSEKTFRGLVSKPPQPLNSNFKVTHGMVLAALQRSGDSNGMARGDAKAESGSASATEGRARSGGYGFLVDLVMNSHESDYRKASHLRGMAERFRSLRRAGIIELDRHEGGGTGLHVVVSGALQVSFSLHQTLSLYLVDAVATLDPYDSDYALNVLSLVEAILQDPRPVVFAQERKAKDVLITRLKAERVPYEQRMAEMDRISWPKPLEDFLELTFEAFAATHPWLERKDIKPKSVAREMAEGWLDFNDYIRRYGLQRSEGTLLRYLGEVYKALAHAVPEVHKDEALLEIEVFLRLVLDGADASLLGEWERLQSVAGMALDAVERPAAEHVVDHAAQLAADPAALDARVRAEVLLLVASLAEQDFETAAQRIHQDPGDQWPAERIADALSPFFDQYGELVFDHAARRKKHTQRTESGPRRWTIIQNLVDPEDDDLWRLELVVDLNRTIEAGEPIIALQRIDDVAGAG